MKRKSKKFLYFILSLLLTTVITAYVLNIIYGAVAGVRIWTDTYRYSQHDIVIFNNMDWYVTDILAKKFQIEGYVMETSGYSTSNFPITVEKAEAKKSSADFHITTLPYDSFDQLRDVLIPKKMVRSCNEKLMKDPYAMALSYTAASSLQVSVGDTVQFLEQTYKIAMIFENPITVSYDGIQSAYIRAESTGRSVYLPYVNRTYLRFSPKDRDAAVQYLSDTYYAQDPLYSKYGKRFMELATEEEKQIWKGSYATPEKEQKKSENLFRQNYIEMVTYLVTGAALIIITQVYENHKQVQLKLKRYTVYRIFGYSKFRFWSGRFMKALLYGTVTMAAANVIVYVKYFSSLPVYLIKELLIPLPVIILVAALLVSLLSLAELRDNQLIYTLRTEE